jgi:hypothetical protein
MEDGPIFSRPYLRAKEGVTKIPVFEKLLAKRG